jgi:hypothetical protein
MSEKIVVIKRLVNVEFSLQSSTTTASGSKHDFEEWTIASQGRILILPGCRNDTFIIVNSEHLTE